MTRSAATQASAGPSDRRTSRTTSGLLVSSTYTAADIDAADREDQPGTFPFTRGIREILYQDEPWVMGQYSGYASPAETNKRIRRLIEQGQGGFSIALDLPTQMGLDSDDPLAKGEVGRVGVPIDSVRDAEELLRGIPLDHVRQIRTSANAIGPIMVAILTVASERLGFDPRSFRVMLQNDILKEYVARGTFIFPARRGMGFSVDVIEYCARELPRWEPIEFCGYHFRDSGVNAVQEVAFAFANAIEYIEATLRRGLSIDEFAHSLFMFLSAHIDLFEEVAKFRATRRMWSRLMRDRFGASREESWKLNLFVYTLGSQLTAREPLNNIARVAYEALAAILGGVQTLATSSYDEALGLPSDDAARVSLRTQQILAFETGVTRVTDPLGGSYYVERLTSDFEDAVQRYLGEIAQRGGALAALESGWIRSQIDDAAYAQQMDIESGERTVVGVNRFQSDQQSSIRPLAGIDASLEAEQVARLRDLRSRRDRGRHANALEQVRRAAQGGRNTVPSIVDAVRADATVGEICAILKGVWGTHKPQ